jgi:ATP-dependent RNA helicase DeaD
MSVENFDQLGLSEPILRAVRDVGYETPSPIQAACIPVLLEGRDLIGQAQTGTGKTAAFALPLLGKVDIKDARPQILVLAPTRELAIQVAEAFQKYAHHLPGLHVLPVYGGQSMLLQLKQLSRGAHVVIGTPGRVIDHLDRGTLKLDSLKCVVLDEADEMLRMGFIDDVERILSDAPDERQTALFSATMPEPIRRIAHQHLKQPAEIKIKTATSTAASIDQVFWNVRGLDKMEALTRILEAEGELDAAIVFVRTKTATVEVADRLRARGHACAELNGDLNQQMRERIIDQIKNGDLDIIVATDVAARGLDVPRISHVINYDVPYDTESYVHRIGRTGRAGRAGKAILFVAPRELRMLASIEKATRQKIAPMTLPTLADISERRVAQFKTSVMDVIATQDLEFFQGVVAQMKQEHNLSPREIAAALVYLATRERPLEPSGKDPVVEAASAPAFTAAPGTLARYRADVGRIHGVEPKNIVGALANEGGLERSMIGRITLHDEYSMVELPPNLPGAELARLSKIRVKQRPLALKPLAGDDRPPPKRERGSWGKDDRPAGDRPPRAPRADGAAPAKKPYKKAKPAE